MADLIGQEIGNYRLLTRLASGGFGSVYLAQHTLLPERKVAIKLLHAFLSSREELEQSLQEARFLEQLKHPYILPLIDVGVSDTLPYLVTEYAPGGSLRDLLKQHQSPGLPQDTALSIISQICQALQYAHQRQVIHSDLKPENILFNNSEEVLLADFGIAMVLANASVQQIESSGGTPRYMAPEQFQGVISKESDQYALGCIAYEMFTGHQAFVAPDIHALAYPILTSYFNLGLALVGFVTGFAFLKTSGRYITRRSLFIAERYGIAGALIAELSIFVVLVAWRAFPQVALFINLSLKFWLSCIPPLLLLPFLLLAGAALVRSYDQMIERRRRTFHT